MNGLATRNKLHAATHASDDDYAHRHGRASDKVMGYLGHEEFTLPDRPFMPNMARLGTPGEARRDRAQRLEAAWSTVFWICIAFTLALVALLFIKAPPANQPRPADLSFEYRTTAAGLMPGQALYFTNSQGCLVYLHKEIVSPLTVSLVSDHC
jgi:hypothetical protein